MRACTMTERYSRQLGLFGYNGQEKLRKSRVVVIGGNLLADFTLAALASLGVGTLLPIAHERTAAKSFLPLEKRVASYQHFFREFDKTIEVYPIKADMRLKSNTVLVPYADVIIDVTHDKASKHNTGVFAKDRGVVLLGYATDRFASVLHASHAEHLETIVESYAVAPENVVTCEITAGLLAEETRKILLPRPNEPRRNITLPNIAYEQEYLPKIAIIGAGALGTWVGIGLALMDIPAMIIDDDVVDETNLNRQFLFYDAIGKPKAKTLARKLSRFGPRYNARVERFSGRFNNDYKVVLSCVDNLSTRSLLNRVAVNDELCVINGGTDSSAGNVETYVPGVSACIACQGGAPDTVTQEVNASCTRAQNSTVIPNLIVSGLMLKRVCDVLAEREDLKKVTYSPRNGISELKISPRKSCGCYRPIQTCLPCHESKSQSM